LNRSGNAQNQTDTTRNNANRAVESENQTRPNAVTAPTSPSLGTRSYPGATPNRLNEITPVRPEQTMGGNNSSDNGIGSTPNAGSSPSSRSPGNSPNGSGGQGGSLNSGSGAVRALW
jgi:hypothetical protein